MYNKNFFYTQEGNKMVELKLLGQIMLSFSARFRGVSACLLLKVWLSSSRLVPIICWIRKSKYFHHSPKESLNISLMILWKQWLKEKDPSFKFRNALKIVLTSSHSDVNLLVTRCQLFTLCNMQHPSFCPFLLYHEINGLNKKYYHPPLKQYVILSVG